MNVTSTQICNMALSRIGIREKIAALTPATTSEAVECELHYETVVDRTLCQYPWTFATKRKTLVIIENNPTKEWRYRYEYPADCVSPRYIEATARNVPVDLMIKWQVEATDAVVPGLYYSDPSVSAAAHRPWRKSILTDETAPVLVYTSNSVPEDLYPGHFVNLLAWNLAVEIAMPLLSKPDVATMAMNAARVALLDARANALNEGVHDNPLESEFVRARN